MAYVATMTANGQITIPKTIRMLLGLESGSKVIFDELTDIISLRKAEAIEDVLADLDEKKSPVVRAAISRHHGKTVAELRDEYATGEAGQVYYKEKYEL